MSEYAGERAASTSVPLHPLLAQRWSPRAMDPSAVVPDDVLRALLEAARWAASDGNSQPWRFVVGRRGDRVFEAIRGTLRPKNQWAASASVLVLGVYDLGGDRPLTHSAYDLGQAVAHLSIQAIAEGVAVHQMGGFSVEGVQAALGVPEGFVPHVVVAIGMRGDPSVLPEELAAKETRPRRRRPLSETAFAAWGEPFLPA
jgi:nitroreductase